MHINFLAETSTTSKQQRDCLMKSSAPRNFRLILYSCGNLTGSAFGRRKLAEHGNDVSVAASAVAAAVWLWKAAVDVLM